MITVRDKSFKKIDDTIYIGIELEQDMNTFLKNSHILLEFKKNNQIVLTNDEIIIPNFDNNNLKIGKKITTNIDFDTIDAKIIEGENALEEIDANVDVVKDENSTNEKIIYKVNNHTNRTLEYLTLNIVFYDKGKLIGGTNITINNVLTERQYYLEFDVPNSLTYTDYDISLFIPPTNRLLFIGFYEKYFEYMQKINELSKLKELEKIDNFIDPAIEKENKLIKAIEKKNKLEKEKTVNSVSICLITILGTFISFLLKRVGGFILMIPAGLIVAIFLPQYDTDQNMDVIFTWCQNIFVIISAILTLLLTYFLKSATTMTKKEKRKKLKQCNDEIIQAKKALEQAKNSSTQLKQAHEQKNQELKEKNAIIKAENDEKQIQANNLKNEFENMKKNYPKYATIQNFDKTDWQILADAFYDGIYDFDDIMKYRKEVREKLEEIARHERELELLEQQNKIEQQNIKALQELKEQERINAENIRSQIKQASEKATLEAQITRQENYYNMLKIRDKLNKANDIARGM